MGCSPVQTLKMKRAKNLKKYSCHKAEMISFIWSKRSAFTTNYKGMSLFLEGNILQYKWHVSESNIQQLSN